MKAYRVLVKQNQDIYIVFPTEERAQTVISSWRKSLPYSAVYEPCYETVQPGDWMSINHD